MTLPAAPQIGSTGLVQQPGIAEQLAPILQQITQKRLADAQIETYQSLTEQRQAEAAKAAREAQDAADAANAFYQHLSGSAQRLRPPKPSKDGAPPPTGVDEQSGMLTPLPQFERGLSPAAHALYVKMLQDHNTTIQQGFEASKTKVTTQHEQALTDLAQVQATQAQQGFKQDRQIQEVLSQFSNRTWNRDTVRQAVGKVVAINPQKAGLVANALNSLLPDYQIHVNDDGTVGYIPRTPGETVGSIQPTRPTDEQNKVANYGVRVLEGNAVMTDLERKIPGIGQRVDDIIRNVRSIEQYPGVGRALATQALRAAVGNMSPDERRYWNARTDLGNALLRRASGAQINMEELDRETTPYAPVSGEDETAVTSKQQRRLQQGLLFAQQSGTAFRPNALSPAARRYLLLGALPPPVYSPDNPYATKP